MSKGKARKVAGEKAAPAKRRTRSAKPASAAKAISRAAPAKLVSKVTPAPRLNLNSHSSVESNRNPTGRSSRSSSLGNMTRPVAEPAPMLTSLVSKQAAPSRNKRGPKRAAIKSSAVTMLTVATPRDPSFATTTFPKSSLAVESPSASESSGKRGRKGKKAPPAKKTEGPTSSMKSHFQKSVEKEPARTPRKSLRHAEGPGRKLPPDNSPAKDPPRRVGRPSLKDSGKSPPTSASPLAKSPPKAVSRATPKAHVESPQESTYGKTTVRGRGRPRKVTPRLESFDKPSVKTRSISPFRAPSVTLDAAVESPARNKTRSGSNARSRPTATKSPAKSPRKPMHRSSPNFQPEVPVGPPDDLPLRSSSRNSRLRSSGIAKRAAVQQSGKMSPKTKVGRRVVESELEPSLRRSAKSPVERVTELEPALSVQKAKKARGRPTTKPKPELLVKPQEERMKSRGRRSSEPTMTLSNRKISPRRRTASPKLEPTRPSTRRGRAASADTSKRSTKVSQANPTKSKAVTLKYALGTAVSKLFPDNEGKTRPFAGTVKNYDAEAKLYKILYEDGDSEELTEKEVSEIINVKKRPIYSQAKKGSAPETTGAGSTPQAIKGIGKLPRGRPKSRAKSQPNTITKSVPKSPTHYPRKSSASSSPTKMFSIGTVVSKIFPNDEGDDCPFSGEITGYDSKAKLYKITYEDGDTEEMTRNEVKEILVMESEEPAAQKKHDTTSFSPGTIVSKVFADEDGLDRPFSGEVTKFDRRTKLYKVVYEDGDSEELTQEEVESIVVTKQSNKITRKEKPENMREMKSSEKHFKTLRGNNSGPKYLIGAVVSKSFLDERGKERPFKGKVQKYNSKEELYEVVYEDGDSEDLTEEEIHIILASTDLTKGKKKDLDVNGPANKRRRISARGRPKNGAADTNATSSRKEKTSSNVIGSAPVSLRASTPARSAKREVNYNLNNLIDMSSSDDEDSSVDEIQEPKSKKVRGNRSTSNRTARDEKNATQQKTTKTSKKGRRYAGKCDEDEDSEAFASDFKSSEDEAQDSDYDNEKKSDAKRGAKNRRIEKKGGKKMYEMFQPMSNPIYPQLSLEQIIRDKSFLDPCGMEATDDIIDRLVGEQLDKIQNLLYRALASGQQNPEQSEMKEGAAPEATLGSNGGAMGSNMTPLILGTACSGTDAPALALTLVQEQLELRGMGGLFKHDHVFSCEVEPFKQAYLARNFDSILYPDISKLCDNPPRDVYGQEQPLPSFNMFVAGTSCKNFSMLMSNKRIDIEDKGCSGETFLAACELLFQEKPGYAIFENVIGAPWEKMSEYITGRVKLSECDSSKAIQTGTKGRTGELEFVQRNGKIVVDKVPAIYGVRCGAIVEGYIKGGASNVRRVKWPRNETKRCTLSEFMKHNYISKNDDTLVFENEVVYCTHYVKVDTKSYGLPQTRQRTYMFVWRPDDDDVEDDLGIYWEAVVKYLESPVRHSLESFILQADHDIIRVFREALNGPAGRHTMRKCNLAPDFWNKENANANLPHNMTARERLGLEELARTQTKWGPFGQMQVPTHWWLEYIKCNGQRQIDLIEILHASAARDAESHDSNYASFFWNISQNASKEKHRSAVAGIAGCITPGGDVFLPHVGRPLLGCEKLLLQGIPYFRLLLGNETEVQLGDLAGNAMSLTVVCATMLAAMTCKQLRQDHKASKNEDVKETLDFMATVSPPTDAVKSEVKFEPIEDASIDVRSLFKKLADLAETAIKSSAWCTCETSGRTSRSLDFLRCRQCSMVCCRSCCHNRQGYQLDSHDMAEVTISKDEHDHGEFEVNLRSLLPPSLVLNKAGLNAIKLIEDDKYRVSGLGNYIFVLHRVKRGKLKWIAIYYAREGGVGEPMAEFKVIIGELESRSETADSVLGVQGELRSFFPAKKHPIQFGPIEPCATVRFCQGEGDGKWTMKTAPTTTSLSIVGNGTTPSFRKEVGLTDDAEKQLKENTRGGGAKSKQFKEAKARGEQRRWIYPGNWKEWPEEITVTDYRISQGNDNGNDTLLGGKYVRVGCRQTFNQSACWIRRKTDNLPELYLMMRPTVSRIGPDIGIISTSSCYDDSTSILATLPCEWEPCSSLDPKKHEVKKVTITSWIPLNGMSCMALKSNIYVECPTEDVSPVLVKVNGLADNDVIDLCCRDDAPGSENEVRLNVHRGAKAQQTVRKFNVLCVAPILKHAAANGLKFDLRPDAAWISIEPKESPFGCCQATIPPRPKESWYFDEERRLWERQSEPGDSRKYFLALQQAPRCFDFVVDRKSKLLTINCLPEVAAHYAAFGLIEGRGKGMERELSVHFRLSSIQEDPTLERFRLHNCHDMAETNVILKSPYKLYERQKRAVTKMLEIENGAINFEEIEMSEQSMPGAADWSLIARASRKATLTGGVIADAIGAGKTVISIAIILQGIAAARTKRSLPRKSSATLVVVPPGLIDQWKREILKFTELMPNIICIYDDEVLMKFTLKQLVEADVVICPVDILESKGYMNRLARVASGSSEEVEALKLPNLTGQQEKIGAAGVWIPASSADPYGGANNPKNQLRRNESAYFTHVYHEYIRQIRAKEFEPLEKGIPLEYFEWERIFVDEIHECLCTTKTELSESKAKKEGNSGFFQEKNRRAGREFLGISTKDVHKRPLVFRSAIFGLTATPLLDNTNRVIELANLMGNAYVIGLSNHWRNLERESGRDIFLQNFLEPKQSREIRRNIYSKCQDYLDRACCKNKNEEDMEGTELVNHREVIKMSEEEGDLYKKSQSGINSASQSFSITPEDFDITAGHDVSKFLRQNAKLDCRGKKLVQLCKQILAEEGNENTKIVVFTDGRIGAGNYARDCLMAQDGLGCTWLDSADSVEVKNKKLAWYQYGDATEEDKKRPRALVLHFEHAAGLNLQSECNNLILFTPLYVGDGGTSGDPVSDASTELQAIGRVFRPGQSKSQVHVYRIEVQGPKGEECLDGHLIRRNTDVETIEMAVNADD